ncbi:HpcH/HpaI aldolase/citrate lyase family protein [Coprinopsis cinerea okayama7|uniref:HpcH/HpaI aldolase/citrate lyase family protein n=1 Tax=Coprinopsis cinerea (strain Okayama-7 / 130 / ATCC MYA-4618 / FGSC 9003) TaxID=240176 RepID=A8P942_COPC7|nr:HpcH/HpaI aldolase/citrate lyase family protein [Coprinopsis cinerea okayama7\|eukprot:XP_001839692.1 HpcH/HpaI aldolase/citrate lyase family protein [Coprinopsis cinerea okayama7\
MSSSHSHPLLETFKSTHPNSKPSYGVWLTLPGTFNARTIAQASHDLGWILIDCEHGLVPLVPGAAETIAAIKGTRTITNPSSNGSPDSRVSAPSTIVRIPATGASDSTSWQIKYALDAGADGVLVPMVSTAAKAREVVQEAKFPPQGRRGFGSPFTHTLWGLSTPDYLASANHSSLVIVQIETKEAVDNVEEIANVEGIDALFIGPYDLSISLGYPPPSPVSARY